MVYLAVRLLQLAAVLSLDYALGERGEQVLLRLPSFSRNEFVNKQGSFASGEGPGSRKP